MVSLSWLHTSNIYMFIRVYTHIYVYIVYMSVYVYMIYIRVYIFVFK